MAKRELIASSLDAKCLKTHLKLLVFVYVGLLVFIISFGALVFWGYAQEMIKAIAVFAGIYSCGYIPAVVYTAAKYHGLIKRSESYYYFDTVLKAPQPSGHRYYFSVAFADANGAQVCAETDRIFSDKADFTNRRDWENKKIRAAYDARSGKIIVIGEDI